MKLFGNLFRKRAVDENLPIKLPSFPQPPESLEELNNLMTKLLKEFDCFDFMVPVKFLDAVKRIVTARGLKYSYTDDDEDPIEGIVFLVVGEQAADFEKHEQMR
jgi:hypothetical protein